MKPASHPSGLRRTLQWGAVALVAFYLLTAAELYFNQYRYIYKPSSQWVETPEERGVDYEDVRFRAADGTALSGWFIRAPRERGVILFCHGHAGNISSEAGALAT